MKSYWKGHKHGGKTTERDGIENRKGWIQQQGCLVQEGDEWRGFCHRIIILGDMLNNDNWIYLTDYKRELILSRWSVNLKVLFVHLLPWQKQALVSNGLN
jgi:hypothetical protein